jgi:hypothetical protein
LHICTSIHVLYMWPLTLEEYYVAYSYHGIRARLDTVCNIRRPSPLGRRCRHRPPPPAFFPLPVIAGRLRGPPSRPPPLRPSDRGRHPPRPCLCRRLPRPRLPTLSPPVAAAATVVVLLPDRSRRLPLSPPAAPPPPDPVAARRGLASLPSLSPNRDLRR